MQRVIGRPTGRQQPDDGIGDGFLVDQTADRGKLVAEMCDGHRARCSRARQCIAQRRIRIDERGARNMQPHDFQQHLVAVGGAVESTGAGAVIGFHFRGEQLLAADLALGELLANQRLFVVRHARSHRPGGHEDRRQVTEAERGDHQPGDDLVADAEIQGRVESIVR